MVADPPGSRGAGGRALPTPSGTRAVGATVEADAAGLSYTTPNDTFYLIDTAIVLRGSTRRSGPADPRTGRQPDDVELCGSTASRPMIERYVTLGCVSNEVGGGLIGNARWLGVPVRTCSTRPTRSRADQVVSRSVDGLTAGTPTGRCVTAGTR